MSETVDALLCDLLAWLAQGAQPYGDVMDAWRTSCPRLPVWEDANDRGLIEQVRMDGCAMVRITAAGRAFLAQRR
jgi:D-3-phosphoglycerate dehydrogenase